jgi:transposase
MSRQRLAIVPHPTPAEIARRYRACRRGVEKTHGQVLGLLTRPDRPLTPAQAAEHVGLTPSWVRTLLKRWNAQGPAGLADRRVGTHGGHPELATEPPIDLWAALQQPPPDGGLWTGPKVAADVRDRWGVVVCKQTGWGWLHELGFARQVPRPHPPEAATPAARRAWKRRPAGPARRTASARS